MWILAGLFACTGNAMAAPAPADLAPAQAHFAAGVAAAADEDFASALAAFQAAAEEGLTGPAVHYNIGVSAWALGDLDTAEAAFTRVMRAPEMAALARYNLGLIQLRRGDTRAAAALFEAVRRDGKDPTLTRLAEAQLDGLHAGVPARPAPWQPAAVFLAANAGYDDNVALVADGEVLGVSDTASGLLQTQLAVIAPLPAALRVEADAYLLRHWDLAAFDQSGLRVELVHERPAGEWTGEFGAGYGLSQLDGARFEEQRGVSLALAREFADGWDVRLRYRFDDINGREPFTALTGDRQEFSVLLRQGAGSRRLRVEYRVELNDRAGDEVSPDRHGLEAEWSVGLGRGLRGALGLGRRNSRYAVDEDRWREGRTLAFASLHGPLAGRWDWTVRYDWSRNSGTVAEFEYTRHRLVAGIQGLF